MFIALLLSVILLPSTALAQITSTSYAPVIEIVLEPSHPAPDEEVVARLSDYRSSSRAGSIAWYIDGSLVDNTQEISFQAPEVSDSVTVEAVLTAPGGTERYSTTITPVYLDIIVEPLTHIPEFYSGRSLPSPQSKVNVVAIIQGTSQATADLLFDWRVNQKPLHGGPLRGATRTSFTATQDSRTSLSLTVSDLQGRVVAKEAFYMPTVSPQLSFYEVHSLYGVLPRTLSQHILTGSNLTLRAVPFYLDSAVYNRPELIEWEAGNYPLATQSNPYEIDLERVGEQGSVNVGFRVQSTTKLLQGSQGDVRVAF